MVAADKKEADQAASKLGTLNKLYSREYGVQGGCNPDWRTVSEESDGGYTMSVLYGGGKIRVSRKEGYCNEG